jgi:DNA-binding NarL/FixJ family response regulator
MESGKIDRNSGMPAETSSAAPSDAITQGQPRQRIDVPHPPLTWNERSVLRLLLDGHANKSIARDLGMGLRTVELRRSTIMKKLGARNLAELVRITLTSGLADQLQAEPKSPPANGRSNYAI